MPVLRYRHFEQTLDNDNTEKGSAYSVPTDENETTYEPETELPRKAKELLSPERTEKAEAEKSEADGSEGGQPGKRKKNVPPLVYLDKVMQHTGAHLDSSLICNKDDEDVYHPRQTNRTYQSTDVNGISECTIDPPFGADGDKAISASVKEQKAKPLKSIVEEMECQEDEFQDSRQLDARLLEEVERTLAASPTPSIAPQHQFVPDFKKKDRSQKQQDSTKDFENVTVAQEKDQDQSSGQEKLCLEVDSIEMALNQPKLLEHESQEKQNGELKVLKGLEKELIYTKIRSMDASLNLRAIGRDECKNLSRTERDFCDQKMSNDRLFDSVVDGFKYEEKENWSEDLSPDTPITTNRTQRDASLLAATDSKTVEFNLTFFESSSSSANDKSKSEAAISSCSQFGSYCSRQRRHDTRQTQTERTSNSSPKMSVSSNMGSSRSTLSQQGFEVNGLEGYLNSQRSSQKTDLPNASVKDDLYWPSGKLPDDQISEAALFDNNVYTDTSLDQSQSTATMDSFDHMENVEVGMGFFSDDVVGKIVPTSQKKRSRASGRQKKKKGQSVLLQHLLERAILSGKIQTKVSVCAVDDSENVEVTVDLFTDDDSGSRLLQRKKISGFARSKKNSEEIKPCRSQPQENVGRTHVNVQSLHISSVPFATDDSENLEVAIDLRADADETGPSPDSRKIRFSWMKNLRAKALKARSHDGGGNATSYATDNCGNVEVSHDNDEEEVHFLRSGEEDEQNECGSLFSDVDQILFENKNEAMLPMKAKGSKINTGPSPAGSTYYPENVEMNLESYYMHHDRHLNSKRRQRMRREIPLIAFCFLAIVGFIGVIAVAVLFISSNDTSNQGASSNLNEVDQKATTGNKDANFQGSGGGDFSSESDVSSDSGSTSILEIFATRSPTTSPSAEPTSTPTLSSSQAPTMTTSLLPSETLTQCMDSISADFPCYNRNNGNIDIVISLEKCSPSDDDWVGIYTAGSNGFFLNEGYAEWSYTCGDQHCNGEEQIFTNSFTLRANINAGWYQLFLVIENEFGPPYHSVASSDYFLVSSNDCADYVL